MQILVLTPFPGMFDAFWSHGILRKAVAQRNITASALNIRDFTSDRHHVTDDRPVALRFDRLGDALRARLDALIAAHTLGPMPLRDAGGAHAAQPSIIRAAAARAGAERRSGLRAPHRREIVALEGALDRVRFALLGVDLSVGGAGRAASRARPRRPPAHRALRSGVARADPGRGRRRAR